jgi:hypothetical protein
MPVVLKANPTLPNVGRSFVGKTITALTIDLAVNGTDFGTTEMGPNGAVQAVYAVIGRLTTPMMISALRADAGANPGQVFDVYIDGAFPTDTYDGTNAETFAAFLQSEIRELTAAGVNAINLNAATVVALDGSPFLADHVQV